MIRRCVAVVSLLSVAACNSSPNTLATGTIERDRIELTAEVVEPIAEIFVKEGQTVDAGAPVVRLDDSAPRAARDQAQAALALSQARLAELLRGPRSEQIAEAEAALSAATAALENATREKNRSAKLARQGLDPQAQLDRATTAHEEALGRRDQAAAVLSRLRTGATAEEVAQAHAVVDEANARLAAAQLRVDRLTLRAPVKATVDALPYEFGERPPPGAPVAVLLSSAAPYARIYVGEQIRARVAAGDRVTLRADGLDRPIEGKVRSVSSEAAFTPFFALTEHDRGRLSYLAEVALDGPDAATLPSGLPVQAELPGS